MKYSPHCNTKCSLTAYDKILLFICYRYFLESVTVYLAYTVDCGYQSVSIVNSLLISPNIIENQDYVVQTAEEGREA
jgi:hypothetical protein